MVDAAHRFALRSLAASGLAPSVLGLPEGFGREDVRALQRRLGVKADGWLGEHTIKAWTARKLGIVTVPGQPEGLRIDRARFRSTHSRSRPKPPQSIVLHDTVDRSARQTHRTLEAKGYGSHFLIDEDGTVYQTMDPARSYGAHAGAFNEESIGIDMVSLVAASYLGRSPGDNERRKRVVTRRWGYPKQATKVVVDYTDAQKVALVALVRWLCERFSIPFSSPGATTLYGQSLRVPWGIDDKTYRGVVGHGQWSSKRWDGNRALEVLWDAGMARVEAP